MKMKISLLCFVLSASLCAMDFGISLDNLSGWSSQSSKDLVQHDRVTLLFSTPISDIFDFETRMNGDFTLSKNAFPAGNGHFAFNVGRFALQALVPGAPGIPAFTGIIGRYAAKSHGSIYSGLADGLLAQLNFAAFDIQFQGGYTGLLPQDETFILMSASDIAEYREEWFAPKRAFMEGGMKFIEPFARQDIAVGLLCQFDLRYFAEKHPDETINTQYASFTLSGPIVRNLYHKFILDSGIGESSDGFLVMGASSWEIAWYIPELTEAKLGFKAEYASGSTGILAPWRPITSRKLGIAFTAPVVNCFYPRVDASFKPFEYLLLGTKASPYFRASFQELNDADFDKDSKDLYLGSEFDLYATLKPTGDFMLSASGGAFVPASGMTFKKKTGPRYVVQATITFTL